LKVVNFNRDKLAVVAQPSPAQLKLGASDFNVRCDAKREASTLFIASMRFSLVIMLRPE
jgi:hypothetical protein